MQKTSTTSTANKSERSSAVRPGFRSFKTASAIHYPNRWHRDLLIQLTFDPVITAIEQAPIELIAEDAFGVFVTDGSSRTLIAATRDENDPPMPAALPCCVSVPRSFVMQEPRCSTARTVWAARSVLVAPGDRVRVLARIAVSPHGAPLASLLDCVQTSQADPTDVVLALVCAGQAEIGIGAPLSPETLVRRRSA